MPGNSAATSSPSNQASTTRNASRPTGTQPEPRDYTDTIIQGQGERGIIEVHYPYTGDYMFHAHKTEFAERGWMGFFRVLPEDGNDG